MLGAGGYGFGGRDCRARSPSRAAAEVVSAQHTPKHGRERRESIVNDAATFATLDVFDGRKMSEEVEQDPANTWELNGLNSLDLWDYTVELECLQRTEG